MIAILKLTECWFTSSCILTVVLAFIWRVFCWYSILESEKNNNKRLRRHKWSETSVVLHSLWRFKVNWKRTWMKACDAVLYCLFFFFFQIIASLLRNIHMSNADCFYTANHEYNSSKSLMREDEVLDEKITAWITVFLKLKSEAWNIV